MDFRSEDGENKLKKIPLGKDKLRQELPFRCVAITTLSVIYRSLLVYVKTSSIPNLKC